MRDAFSKLGWFEASLRDLSYQEGALAFEMLDLLSCTDPLKYEVVEVRVEQVEALHLLVNPYRDGRYIGNQTAISVGSTTDSDECFEGVLLDKRIGTQTADFFWALGHVRANRYLVRRTGRFEYIPIHRGRQ